MLFRSLSKGCRASRNSFCPVRIVLVPTLPFIPVARATAGFRMSQSMRTTAAPLWARVIAMFVAVDVFPSHASVLVTKMVRGGSGERDSSVAVRSAR